MSRRLCTRTNIFRDCKPSDEDRTKIASAFQDNSKAFEEGITLNGTRYTVTEIRETPVEEKNIPILHAAQVRHPHSQPCIGP